MDAIFFLEPKVPVEVIDNDHIPDISAHSIQILDILTIQFNGMMAIQSKRYLFHMIDNDIGIFRHAACENANLIMMGHLGQELKQIGSDEELALVLFGDFIMDQSLI